MLNKKVPLDAIYIGRGGPSGPPRSRWANPFPVCRQGSRDIAITLHEAYVRNSPSLLSSLGTLSGLRLCCHCRLAEDCHGDTLIRLWHERFDDSSGIPPTAVLVSPAASSQTVPPCASTSASPSPPSHPVPPSQPPTHPQDQEILESPDRGGFRDFQDGAGLCSPGRRRPQHREVTHPVFGELRNLATSELQRWGDSLPGNKKV